MRKLEFVASVQFLSLCIMIMVVITTILKCGLDLYCTAYDRRVAEILNV